VTIFVAEGQAEPSALASRLRREEWLEQLVLDLGRNADPIVADADFDRFAEIVCRHRQRRLEVRRSAFTPFGSGVEPVVDQIDEDAADLLRRQFERGDIAVKPAL
jgi:hypothetical protein